MRTLRYLFLVVGFNSQAAVHINSEGLGEVLLVPYFTVNNGLNTLNSVTNTTRFSKAVKIIFKEGNFGEPIGSINLYLAPHDSWTYAVAAGPDGPQIISNDRSCTPGFTSPMSLSQDSNTPNSNPPLNLNEGTIEVYEMGYLVPESGFGLDITFADGEVRNCAQIEANWLPGGVWLDIDPATELTIPVGGLRATAALIDVVQGVNYDMPVTALSGFYSSPELTHTAPDVSTSPALTDADTFSSVMDTRSNGFPAITIWPTGIEAVSAALMKHKVHANYSIEAEILGETEMIISFPTKPYHFQDEGIIPPFTAGEGPGNNYLSCEPFEFDLRTRNGANSYRVPGSVSPRPPILCTHSNGLKVSSYLDDRTNGDILGFTQGFFGLWVDETLAGTIELTFNQSTSRGEDAYGDLSSQDYTGLPMIGVTFQRYTNANAQPGLLAQYGSGTQLLSEIEIIESAE